MKSPFNKSKSPPPPVAKGLTASSSQRPKHGFTFPIACIGASAGGLEAFQELLKNLSAEPGMAFVFIMHLAPEHKSMLSELLSRITKMPVSEAKNGISLEVNHVYVIPPKMTMSIAREKLVLTHLAEPSLRHMPIDCFFHSLAKERGNGAIGVILSGTATDGTLGAEAIKAEGGIVFAQDEDSAKYAGMPQSAIQAGCVDFVLRPEKIAHELELIAKHPYMSRVGFVKTNEALPTINKGLGGIVELLRRTKGLDFTYYKAGTIGRRVARRMVLLKLKKLDDYTKFLRENKDEIDALYEDLLINVTSFFRDPEVFDALKKQVLPAILKNKKKDQETRIWVPGCASGEEAYSIALCFLESLEKKAGTFPVQIFATDVSEKAINKARKGIYGKNIKDNITPERLKRFFTKDGDSYRVSKQLRDMCVFSKQNVFSDPPFSNIDFVSCRNLLIYFQPVLQKKVFQNFHYALRSDGFLLLGKSEAASGSLNLFKALAGKQKIFAKKYLPFGQGNGVAPKYYLPNKLEIKEKTDVRQTGVENIQNIEGMIDRIVLDKYAPCGVLINSDMEVVQFRGRTGRYLESAAGKPSMDIFKLAREGLFLPLRAALYKAKKTKRTVKETADKVKYNGHGMQVNITVVPAKIGVLKEEFSLVLFDEMDRAVGLKNLPKARGKQVKGEKVIESLQKELIETKEYLQSVTEGQETANEEVKAANEELQSSNEELQSTNEELETSKEELQSSNEELMTANDELQNRSAEVSLLNNDLINLLSSINTPIVMMGRDLVIRRVTPQAEKVLNIIPSDIGRPINKIKLNVDIPDFEKILDDVVESIQSKTFEIKDKGNNWFSVSIRPYRTVDNKIDGVVAIFVDITETKQAQQNEQKIIEEARAYSENIVETVREPLIILSTDLKIVSANRSFYQTFEVNPEETEGRFIYDLGNRQWDIPQLRRLLEDILPDKKTIEAFKIEYKFEGIGQRTMLVNARCILGQGNKPYLILLAIEDISRQQKHLELELVQKEDLEKSLKELDSFAYSVSHDLKAPLRGIGQVVDWLHDDFIDKLNDEQKENMNLMKSRVGRMQEMIDGILRYSRLGRGGEVTERVDLQKLVADVIDSMQPPEGIELKIEGTLPTLSCVLVQIEQVFQNLISNAIHYIDKKNGRIKIGCRDNHDEWVFSVEDNGPGIAKEHFARIFQIFQTLKPRDEVESTGIGLSIVKKLVELHNGRVWLESEMGKGSTFFFSLLKESSQERRTV